MKILINRLSKKESRFVIGYAFGAATSSGGSIRYPKVNRAEIRTADGARMLLTYNEPERRLELTTGGNLPFSEIASYIPDEYWKEATSHE